MGELNPYWIITAASVVVIVSYFFNLISKRTNFPSVLLLLILGMLIKSGLNLTGIDASNLDSILELLGIIGLVMIVLEAALDLRFSREKAPLIFKALLMALLSLITGTLIIALLIRQYIDSDFLTSMIHAIPMTIVSSAIIIPSVVNFREHQREFMVYEATFSDILGILFFYFTIESTHFENVGVLAVSVVANLFITVIASFFLSVILIFLFQQIKTQVKLFLLLSVLLVFFSLGKLLHLSSLIIILTFGLMLENKEIIFGRFFSRFVREDALNHIHINFKLITLETSFIIRTFFFVTFGMTITLASVFDMEIIFLSTMITGLFLGIRYVLLKVMVRRRFNDILYLIPRGLITILLFYSIPPEFQEPAFDPGILFLTILFTSVIMSVSLLHQKWQQRPRIIRKEHVCEVYGRFIPEEWVPGPSVDDSADQVS
jgi:Kef-type K+ transport system membrane component KefB